ncbi:SGNH/GDSL hydrolase family protein [Algoriphagus sp. H41]|uniref:SGNH/GDSL hydrolase family protein n=1 Tax=Algoriphagus oliviformis TaxID=2811231 RepID=A0ABS3C174_9BACT|nr:SGNH/GDSL hydrolase family protein [Algoriphagus oliviformis]MBN7810693.1 SGNH/GDSL hydrolase family protein [Algoriphagus oliviformis]
MSESSATQNKQPLTYLALGDSYTIGEGVEEKDRYPVQLVRELNRSGSFFFSPPEIIARTGWTVDELEAGINSAELSPEGYDLVTLLIGVNNQYRGRPVAEFEMEFEAMLNRAIGFARGRKDHVIVVSIPDWGVTPFAAGKGVDPEKVALEINAFNAAKQAVCSQMGVAFVGITEDYREIGAQPEMVVADELHPSGLVYARWTTKLLTLVQKTVF